MNPKIQRIKDKERAYHEISLATGNKPNSIKCNWFSKNGTIPECYLGTVNTVLDKCIEFEKKVKEIEIKYFGK